jgi:hypothetical protein
MKALAILIALAATAHAEPVTLGLFAPSSPFPSTAARVELASKLGDSLGRATGSAGTGKVYARAADFASAVRKGDINVALVDAAYLASAGGSYTVIAAAVRGGETMHGWQLVARGGKVADLKGKRVLVPSIGGRESEFVTNVLFGGEIARDYFGRLDTAPDTSSALAALGLGKADAAIVPTGVELPSGMTAVLTLPAVSGPVLVAYGSVSADRRAALITAATAFHGDATVGGFRAGDAEAVRSISRRFSVAVKRGPLAVPAVRLLVGELVEGRTLAIERTPATTFAVAPPSDGHH